MVHLNKSSIGRSRDIGGTDVVTTLFRAAREREEIESLTELESGIASLKAQINERNAEPSFLLELASRYALLRQHSAAVETLRAAIHRFPESEDVYYRLLRMLHKCGRDQEALLVGQRACELFPDNFILRLWYHLYIPKLYISEPEIQFYRQRFENGLARCVTEFDLSTRDTALKVARGLGDYSPFYLAYQASDDIELIRRYGQFLHRVMAAAYPQWVSRRTTKRDARSLRVGFVSAYFRKHTVGEHFLGWLNQRDPTAYEARCYYLGQAEDSVTEDYRRATDSFIKCRELDKICSIISADQPDILVFTDVAMDSLSSQLTALRLAPVQCVTYGHPITTGLPTVDYFISGELMEPPEAQVHYTETLVQLPGLAIYYKKPVIPRPLLTKARADFGFRDNAVIFFCCQSLFKYLPQHDHLLAEIAQNVPNAQFAFIANNELLSRKLLERLEKNFALLGLRAADYCRFLPYTGSFDYFNLLLISDIFLDPPGWSGGRSSLDAVSCGLPIVTMAGQYARQRQANAILNRLGVTETIARTAAEYVNFATNLAKKPSFRQSVIRKMELGHDRLFCDTTVVRAFESFLRSIRD